MFDYLSFFHSLDAFGIRPGLECIQELMSCLQNPERRLSFIHVAGTNGKGSVSTFLSEILQAAGYKTGLFLSPYVVNFRERIQINSQMISAEVLAKSAERVKDAVRQLNKKDIIITEFEAVTAAALLCFLEQSCEVVVLETGLGGRFDATNIIPPPLVSVICSISLDHTQILGSTLSEISREKCGIIKAGSPVITSDTQAKEALVVIQETSKMQNSPLHIAENKDIKLITSSIYGNEFLYKDNNYKIGLAGEHQLDNAHIAIKTADVLNKSGLYIGDSHIKKGLEHAAIPARIQILSKEPLIILDGSHNPASTKALAALIKRHLAGKKLLGLIGMMGDKDYESSIKNLAPLFCEIITTTPKNPRAVSAEVLARVARKYCEKTKAINSPANALKQAELDLKEHDVLVICGSLYLAGDILNIL